MYLALNAVVLIVLVGYLTLLASPLHMGMMPTGEPPVSQELDNFAAGLAQPMQVVGLVSDCFIRCLIEWGPPPGGRSLHALTALLLVNWLPGLLEQTTLMWVLPRALGPPVPIDLLSLLQVLRL